MRHPLSRVWLLSVGAALVASGCATNDSVDQPAYGDLTGSSTTAVVERGATTAAAPTSVVDATKADTTTTTTAAVTTTSVVDAIKADTTTTIVAEDMTIVPDLASVRSVASIQRVLQDADLASSIEPVDLPYPEADNPYDLVAIQDPEAGALVVRGSTVEVLIYPNMPDVPAAAASPGSWEHFSERDGLASDCVTSIDVASNGTVWVGCSRGLSTFDGGAWATIDIALDVIEVVADSESGIWVSSLIGDSGVVMLRQFSTGAPFDLDLGSPVSGVPPVVPERFYGTEWTAAKSGPGWGAAIADNGVVWSSDPEDGLLRYDSEWVLVSRPPWMSEEDARGVPAMGTEEIWTDSSGNLWAVTDGLSRFDGSVWETHLYGAGVTDIDFGAEGTVWVATSWRGAYSFDGTTWRHYGSDDGLVSEELTSVAVGRDGSVWFGTAANGVMRFTSD